MAMTVLPATLPKDANRIRGSVRAYLAPWVAGGANPYPTAASIVYAGQIADGGVDLNIGREWQELEGEEGYAPDGDVLTKETCVIKATLMEAPINMIALLMGSTMTFAANEMQASDVKTTSPVVAPFTEQNLGYGGMQIIGGAGSNKYPTNYYQVIIEAANEDFTPPTQYGGQNWSEPGKRGYWQIFMCRLNLTGDLKFTKKNIVTLPIEIHARWDWSVTPVANPISGDSVGRLFRRVAPYTTL